VAEKETKSDERWERARETRQRLQEDHKWIDDNKTSLIAAYEDRFVAVMDKKVLYSDADVMGLMVKIKADGGRMDNFAVECMSRNPPVFLMASARA
jgi:hypothetical protein